MYPRKVKKKWVRSNSRVFRTDNTNESRLDADKDVLPPLFGPFDIGVEGLFYFRLSFPSIFWTRLLCSFAAFVALSRDNTNHRLRWRRLEISQKIDGKLNRTLVLWIMTR